jgi:hypothetical protein
MLRPWAQWLINHNMRFVLQLIIVLTLPLFWFAYIGDAMDDAERAFDAVKMAKKGN